MIMMIWKLLLFIVCVALKYSLGNENIKLDISQGSLIGLKNITAYHGKKFYSFRGIPYAKPNIGRDKFNVAVPLTNWSGILNATKHGNCCPQLKNKKIIGDENCLFLNVYTPDLDKNSEKAVMVFIHGGEFIYGSGDDFFLGPDFLVEKDIVVVTMNYRLGPIGFLNTGDANAPGNVGLKDQNLALKWVQENIVNFGGSPKRVTIFGQSAGAASVHYHMLSPMSQGLFSGVIIQSGAAVSPWAITYTPKDNAIKLGNILDINETNTTKLVEKMKDKSAWDLIVAFEKMKSILKPGENFLPAIEINVGQDIFLPDDPWKILTSGKISDVPVIIGLTENELGSLAMILLPLLLQTGDPLGKLIPDDLNITDPTQYKSIKTTFKQFYFNSLPIFLNTPAFSRILNDAVFNHGSLISADIINAKISSPVYKYLFNYKSHRSLRKKKFPLNIRNVVHGDDIKFIFYSYQHNGIPEPGSLDEKKTDEMIEMWTNFAKNRNPCSTMESVNLVWQPTDINKNYLEIGNELELKSHLWSDRIKLWANIYKNIIGDYIKLFN